MAKINKLPSISLIVLNYNGRKITEQCIESLLKTNYPYFEIIVIDNGSTDDSFAYLKSKYKQRKTVIVARTKENLYWAGGCDYGVQYTKGDFLFFLNNDVTVDKNWLNEMVDFMGNRKNLIIQPKVLNFYEKSVIDNVGGRYVYPGFGFGIARGEADRGQYDRNVPRDYIHGMLLIHKKYYQELGGFDPWYRYHYEDVDLCLRAKRWGGEAWYCYKSIIYHMQSLTFKTKKFPYQLSYHVRKNRLRTIIKNFTGVDKWMRISVLLAINCGFIVLDLVKGSGKKKYNTLRSIRDAFSA